MKQCLLCFSLYPEDSEIGAEQLVHWWVGEGFIEGRNTSTTMELAFDYLSELISRCLVEVVQRRGYDGRVYSCQMHDLVRDLTIKIAREEGFGSFDDQGRQRPSARSRRLSLTNEADYLPQGIGRLSNLQELSGFKLVGADNKDGWRLAELQNLCYSKSCTSGITEEELPHNG
ncbi:hypothetical protein NC651_027369 [Populus alba x Populus x berolinensis]|nr:hypothetical protein NC651_027369 [Populus alba x Populus x berolinensis]